MVDASARALNAPKLALRELRYFAHMLRGVLALEEQLGEAAGLEELIAAQKERLAGLGDVDAVIARCTAARDELASLEADKAGLRDAIAELTRECGERRAAMGDLDELEAKCVAARQELTAIEQRTREAQQLFDNLKRKFS